MAESVFEFERKKHNTQHLLSYFQIARKY